MTKELLMFHYVQVKMLTNDEPNSIPHILTALQGSTVVDVQVQFKHFQF